MTVRPSEPGPDKQCSSPPPAVASGNPITRLPVIVLLVHHRCNCRCLMCHLWKDDSRRALSPADVAGWLAEWRALKVQRLVISGGEPLLYPSLAQLAELISGAGLSLTILTNGLLLHTQAELVARYCQEVVVSLDGPGLIHDQIRGVPGAFAQLKTGLAKVKAAAPGLLMTGRCTVQRHNYRYLRQTVDAAHHLGLERISFLAADTCSGAFSPKASREPEPLDQVMLTPEDLPPLAAEIEALEREYAADMGSGYIAEIPLKLRLRILQYFTALLGQSEFFPHDCNAPWVSAVIEPNGDVRPCFFHPPLGNLYETGSLEAILNSPRALAWRQRLNPRRHETCRRCVCSLNLPMALQELA
jgi:MoaA/NifB/PqqE/SkfB family radical SAM enzyme